MNTLLQNQCQDLHQAAVQATVQAEVQAAADLTLAHLHTTI